MDGLISYGKTYQVKSSGLKPTITSAITASSDSLPCIDADEIAFAMALFVGTVSGRIHSPGAGVSGFPVRENLYDLFDPPIADDEQAEGHQESSRKLVPLSRAISVLWHHYNGDARQRAIWSRVVAFYALVVRTNGSIVEGSTRQYVKASGSAFLDAAVVGAVAAAPLGEFGQFDHAMFASLVETFESQTTATMATVNRATPEALSYTRRIDAHIPASAFTRNLAEWLVAQESSALPSREAFQVLSSERLGRPLTGLVGSFGFRAMLSRAVAANQEQYPWLVATKVTSRGCVPAFAVMAPCPSAEIVIDGEVAVVASLLELIRSLLGSSVTSNLLREVWPQASFSLVPDEGATPTSTLER